VNKYARIGILVAASVVMVVLIVTPRLVDKSLNQVLPLTGPLPSNAARLLHRSMMIGDLHADASLWRRDLLERGHYGHVDIPRLLEGNVGLQMFTAVTRTPLGQNYDSNASDALDMITPLSIVQTWPLATWVNLTERALYQAKRLERVVEENPEQVMMVRNRGELIDWLALHRKGQKVLGVMLGIEGSHALEGKLENVDRLRDAGFTMMGLQHFFDNELGGSLHGESGVGLTEFGHQAVSKMLGRGVLIDVAHSSPQVVEDVLAMTDRALIVSHTGFQGHCPTARNISDELMQKIAAEGGLVGVGFWKGAVCDATPDGIVGALRYGIDLLGEDHIALGSDFDGGISTYFDTSQLVLLTDAMQRADFTENEIRKVMGENMLRFLRTYLPHEDD
jgi:membrane dipeptidase